MAIVLKSIKEHFMDKSFLRRAIPIALSVWIIGLTIYQCSCVGFSPFVPLNYNTTSILVDALKRIHISGSHIINILYALGFNLIAMLIGSRVLRWLKVEPDSITTRLAFATPIGLGIYSIGVFWIGMSGLLYRGVVYVFLALLVILSSYEIKPFLKNWRERTSPGVSPVRGSMPYMINPVNHDNLANLETSNGVSKIDYMFLPLIGLFLVMPLFVSFSPVVHADALMYHMGLPKIYLTHHGITYVPYNVFSAWPANTEMLFLLGLLVSGESLSQLFSFSISLVFLFAIFSFGKRFFSKTVGYLCAIIFLLIPSFLIIMSTPMVDTNLTLYAIVGIYAFLIWIEKKSVGWLYLSAVCCGFAGTIKFQGLFFTLIFFIGFFLTVKKDAIGGRRLLYCMLAMGVIVLPWYLRSWILTGNPVFPFIYNFFGGKNWNDYSKLCHDNYHAWEFSRGIRSLKEFAEHTRRLFSPSSTYAPIISNPLIFLMFLIPGLISFKAWNKTARYLFFTALAHYVFILIVSPQIRYLFPCFAILSIIVAYFVTMIWELHARLKIIIVLSLVTFVFVGLLKTYIINEKLVFVGLGINKPQEYLKNCYSTLYDLCQWTNKNLAKGSKVLIWSVSGGYFLDNEYVWIDPVWQGHLDFGKINNPLEFLTAIKKLNITHILYSPDGLTDTPNSLPHKQFLKLWHQALVDSGKIALLKQIGDSGIYAVVPSPDYFALDGNTIRFNDESQRKHLVRGWSSTEAWGTWSEGEESIILVNFKGIKNEIASPSARNDKWETLHPPALPSPSPQWGEDGGDGEDIGGGKDYTMLIKATGFSMPGKQQSVKIYLDDNFLGEHTFTHPVTYFEDIEIKIPSTYIKEGNQRIKFVYSFTGIPAEHDMGPDLRQLAMGVSSIKFK